MHKVRHYFITLGIILLFVALTVGAWTFMRRHTNKELISNPPKTSNVKSQAPQEPSFDKKTYSLTDPSSIWVIVNKKRPLGPLAYTPTDLVSIGNSQQLRSESATALKSLMSNAKTSGLIISPLSGYRSYNTQVTVYGNEVKNFGQTVADTESARPGHSEHQTGLAVDVGGGGCGIENCFGDTTEGKWLAIHAYEYGFIIRYTADKQAVTGYRAEPWHIRYIGTTLSTEMHTQNITTLEEFFSLGNASNY